MINDIQIFEIYTSTKYELIKTLEKRINFQNLSNEKAQQLTIDMDEFIIKLRKYWM